MLFAVLGGANPIAVRLREIVSPGAGTGRTRVEIWRTALAAWRARPWIGNGPDTLAMLFTLYQTPEYWRYEWLGLAGHAHDIYLHVLATRGVLGLAAGAACAATLAMAARASWNDGAGSRGRVPAILAGVAALAVAGGFGALGIAGALCLTLLAAMTVTLASPAPRPAAAPPPKKKRAVPSPVPDPRARRAALVGALGALAIAIPMAREMQMSHEVSVAYGWVSLGQPASDPAAQALYAEMIGRCRRVLHHAPWDDNAPAVLAEATLRSSFGAPDPRALLAEAESSARDAVHRVPLRSANHRRLALVLSQASQLVDPHRLPEADAEFARAMDLAPQDALVLVEWTRSRLATGRPREALVLAERAVRLYPESGLALGALGEARLAVADTLGARAALERAAASDQGTNPAAQQRAADLLGSLTGRR